MKVLVCVKTVRTELVYPNENRIEKFVMNPYDLFAVEQVIKLKGMLDCQVICLCMGPEGSKQALQKAIAMGADEAILLNDNAFQGSDTVATSYILTNAIKRVGSVDMVVCGKEAIDGETGQVVYGVAERMGYHCISDIQEFISADESGIIVKQSCENDFVLGKITTPVMVSCSDFSITQPKVSLMGLKKARRKEITVWNAEDIAADVNLCGINGSKTKVLNVQKEILKKPKTYVDGSLEEQAKLLYKIVMGKAVEPDDEGNV